MESTGADPDDAKLEAVMRVAGEQFDAAHFLLKHPSVKPDATWAKGDQRAARARTDSGFTILLGASLRSVEMVEILRRELSRLARAQIAFTATAYAIDEDAPE